MNDSLPEAELLSPAGSWQSLKAAVLYGADAVYLGTDRYSLRAKARNFSREDYPKAVCYAHDHGVKVYAAVNILAHNQDLEGFSEYLHFLSASGTDALIMADEGMVSLCRREEPDLPVHLSTQASATNSETFRFWADQGVRRIVAARELSLEEIRQIRQAVPEDLEIEAFVHGAMCIGISGRCLLSAYMAGRDSNHGLCAQPCRWEYALMEQTRPGEYFPVFENDQGTYLFNSKDLCMAAYLPQMLESGIQSLKIEGRMKTPLYVAVVTSVYRRALDDLSLSRQLYQSRIPEYLKTLGMISHRGYTTGFYLERPDTSAQIYETAACEKQIELAALVLEVSDPDHALVEQRGKFSEGDPLLLLEPGGKFIPFTAGRMEDENGLRIISACHAQEKVYLSVPPSCVSGCVIARYSTD